MSNNKETAVNILRNEIINDNEKTQEKPKNKLLKKIKKKNIDNKDTNVLQNNDITIIGYINNRNEQEVCEDTINKLKDTYLINDYILELIPAGTKGVIRGNKFNSIVKDTINNLKLNKERFEICFEKQCELCNTSEIPDWYILEKLTCKVIIGMNQLSLWGCQLLNYNRIKVYNTL